MIAQSAPATPGDAKATAEATSGEDAKAEAGETKAKAGKKKAKAKSSEQPKADEAAVK
jgi:hypothetical protein